MIEIQQPRLDTNLYIYVYLSVVPIIIWINPTYGRHLISWLVLIVQPLPNKFASLVQKLPSYKVTKIKFRELPSFWVTELQSYWVTKLPSFWVSKFPIFWFLRFRVSKFPSFLFSHFLFFNVLKFPRFQVSMLPSYQV